MNIFFSGFQDITEAAKRVFEDAVNVNKVYR